MRNSRYRYTRLVMALYAVGIFVGGFLLLGLSESANEFHGFGQTEVELWFARFIGLLFAAMAILLSTTSRQVEDKSFQRATLALIAVNVIIAMAIYSAPGQLTTGRQISTIVFGIVAFLFLITLPIKPIGYKEVKK